MRIGAKSKLGNQDGFILLKDEKIVDCIKKCITSNDKKEMLSNYRKINEKVFELSGGFEIDGFVYKSLKSI